jgi:hypothetical protein
LMSEAASRESRHECAGAQGRLVTIRWFLGNQLG